jgi:hypothetical protein
MEADCFKINDNPVKHVPESYSQEKSGVALPMVSCGAWPYGRKSSKKVVVSGAYSLEIRIWF